MRGGLCKILCVATLALLLLVDVQQWTGFVRQRGLTGYFPHGEFPAFTVKSFKEGTWQHRVDEWLRTECGFHESGIRLYNQWLWSIFRQSNNHEVMVGRDGVLYERYFVEDHYGKRMHDYFQTVEEMEAACDLEARRLARLQQALDSLGIKFLLWISPGKDHICPETLPTDEGLARYEGHNAYETYLPLLDKYGVTYIDFCSWFKEIKDTVSFDIMPPLGTHWSNIASVYAFDSVLRRLQSIGGVPIPSVTIGKPYGDRPRDPDHDLEDLLNICSRNRRPLMYADVAVADTDMPRPKVLVVGDSFFQVVNRNFPFDRLFQYLHFWSYNKIILYDPEHEDVEQVDMAQELRDADYVIVAFCTSQLYDFHGFPLQALDALGVASPQ